MLSTLNHQIRYNFDSIYFYIHKHEQNRTEQNKYNSLVKKTNIQFTNWLTKRRINLFRLVFNFNNWEIVSNL